MSGLGFQVEASKKKTDKLERPVFFGENGIPTLLFALGNAQSYWIASLLLLDT